MSLEIVNVLFQISWNKLGRDKGLKEFPSEENKLQIKEHREANKSKKKVLHKAATFNSNPNVTPDTETSEYSWNALGVAEEDFSNNDGLLEQDEEEELQFELYGRTDPEAVQYISG